MSDGTSYSLASTELGYLTCQTTANPKVSTIELTSDKTAKYDNLDAVKVRTDYSNTGDQITMTVTTRDAQGNPKGYVPITLNHGFTVARTSNATNNGKITNQSRLIYVQDSYNNSNGYFDDGNKYYSMTSGDGTVTFILRQIYKGDGTRIPLTAEIDDGNGIISNTLSAIFTTVTSPDTPKANFWGHMPETLTAKNGKVFHRPQLKDEVGSSNGLIVNNEYWQRLTINNALSGMQGGCKDKLPSIGDLQSLYETYPSGTIETAQGWPLDKSTAPKPYFWSRSVVSSSGAVNPNYQYINLKVGNTGHVASDSADLNFQTCLESVESVGNITLTTAEENWDSSLPAGKAHKGSPLPLTITVTRADGSPAPFESVGILRAASYNRAGTSLSETVTTDDLVADTFNPAQTIQSASMNGRSNTSYLVIQTDAQGKATLNLHQDSTTGLRTPITVKALGFSPMPTATLDAIFTVITSPDVSVANMWGHMGETLTAADGSVFVRPKIQAELSNTAGVNSKIINSETWIMPTVQQRERSGTQACEDARYPSADQLVSLYNRYPNGTMMAQTGWPVEQSGYYWWTSKAGCDATKEAPPCESVSLYTGAVEPQRTRAMQACLLNPNASVSAVTLTSPAFDSSTQAAKVKKGESMPVTVTVRDNAGNPVSNVAFSLKRGDAAPRNPGATLYGDVAAMDELTVQPPTGATVIMTDSGNSLQGTTGSDGTATFMIKQDNTPGYKTPLTVTLTDNTSINATMDAIFTVVTSPNVASAYFWGHMSDTETVSGKTLHRPLLKSELPSNAVAAVTPVVNNEIWALAHTVDSSKWDLAKQCGRLGNAPEYSELQTLHSRFSALGWPSSPSFPYLSQSRSGSLYCGIIEPAGSSDCAISPATTPGFATCFQ